MKRGRNLVARNPLETSLLDMEERAELLELEGAAETKSNGRIWRCCHSCSRCCFFLFRDVGAISIVVMMALLVAGILLLVTVKSIEEIPEPVDQLSRFIISAGVFGLAGGGTNALAVFMLLYKIPLLYGSGVFYRQHQQIRNVIRMIVLQLLFNSEHLQNYISKKIREFSSHVQVTESIAQALNSPEAARIIEHHLDIALAEPEAQFLEPLGLNRKKIEATVRPAVLSLCAETAPFVLDNIHQSQLQKPKYVVLYAGKLTKCLNWSFMLKLLAISVPRFRKEMDQYLTWRVEELAQERTGQLMRELMYQHLGWVVVWGSVLGALSGIVTQGVRISLNFNFIRS